METISSNHWSHDLQIADAIGWLELTHPEAWAKIIAEFPEADDLIFVGSAVDWDEMGIDPDWTGWLTMAIEDTGLVIWEDGEPWAVEA